MKDLIKIKNQYFDLIRNDNFDFQKFNQFAVVHHSNAIEGSTLTKEETFLLLEEHLTPKNKPLEYTLMAIDHLEALKFVINLADTKTKLTLEIIQKIVSLVMKTTGSEISSMAGDFDSSKGDFRKLTVRAGTTTFMDYKKVPDHVTDLLRYVNEKIVLHNDFINVNNLAFEFHYQLVTIHPFADGNGRMSRLMMHYVQQFHKLPLTIVYEEDKQDYIGALLKTRTDENVAIFIKFMFEQTEKFLTAQIATLTQKQDKKKPGKGFSFMF